MHETLYPIGPAGGLLSDRVSAGIITGSMETGRVPWIRFTVTCVEAEAPLITIPKIKLDDLEKRDGDYPFVVE